MRKTRGVLVGTNAYPFLMFYWLKLFNKVWCDEVDHVYMVVSTPVNPSVYQYVKKVLESNKKITVITTNMGWPDSINMVAKEMKEDIIIALHDDTLIYKKGLIDELCDIVEETDMVVTPLHGNYSNNEIIEELMQRKWPNQLPMTVGETGETGYSFYCYLFLLKRQLFDKTSKDFGEWHVKKGEYCEELGFTPLTQNWHADTNFKLGLELLEAGAKFYGIPKSSNAVYYNMPEPMTSFLKDMADQVNIFHPEYKWMHIQTMAYHIGGLYWDLGEREALTKQRGEDVGPKIHGASPPGHIAKWINTFRIAMIYEFMSGLSDYGAIQKYYNHVKKELQYVCEYYDVSTRDLRTIQGAFHSIIWND